MANNHRALRLLGLNVRKERERQSITQEKLGEKADLDPTYISGIERGVRNPSILSVVRLAKALGSSVSEITEGIG
jgi:transcriptional regulator with XRE-family HTH domain